MGQMGMGQAQGYGLMGLTPSDPYFRGLGAPETDIKKGQKFNSDFSYYWFRQPIWGQIWVIWVLGRPKDMD